LVQQGELHVHLLRIRYSFDRSVLHVCYSAEEDQDMRELMRQLEQRLHTRLDMRLLGVRDSAALTGGVGTCGQKLCCSSWMRRFEAVNVKMAKVQGLSLNPAAISGSCGRLKCCLRYEYDYYREAGQRLPRLGAKVETADGKGAVLDVDILRQTVKVALDDERIVVYDADKVREARGARGGRRRDDDEDSGAERTELESAGKEGA
jgi:cell fate regulator YaaT (PSP1 superfamily)